MRMKVAVITRHAISNYGSLLQTMATQRVIEELGHSCEIINYVRADETYREHEKTLLERKPSWNNNPIKKALYLGLRQPESILAGRRFESFQSRYLHLTKRYATREQLIADMPFADCYVTGSDQVWGPVENGTYDDCYCLSFTGDRDRRFSYAASFGKTEFTPDVVAYYTKWLQRYDQILVREDSAVQKLAEWGLSARQVVDPTLLILGSEWEKFISYKPKSRYVLAYQLHNDKRLGAYAKELAKRKKLELIRVSPTLHQISREGRFVWCPDVGKFLSLIKYAECMVTDSFHGTAFALNFNTPFVEVLPNNNTGTRNMSILRLTKLTDRILGDEDDYGIIDREIDFGAVNSILTRERKRSIELFDNMLNS